MNRRRAVVPLDPLPSLDALLRERAEREPERPLLSSDGQTLRAGELASLAGIAAARLAALGIGPGDRLALWGQNSSAWVVWLAAAAWRGAAIVALHPGLGREELTQALGKAKAGWLILEEVARGRSLRDLAQEVTGHACDGRPGPTRIAGLRGASTMPGGDGRPDLHALLDRSLAAPEGLGKPSDPLAYLFTSGSSGRPKLVQLSHHALMLNAQRTAACAGIDGSDRIATPLPLHHAGGLSSGLLLSLVTGARWCSLARFQPQAWARQIEAEQCTVVQGVPTMFKALMEEASIRPGRCASLRLGFIGAAHVPSALSAAAVEVLGLDRMCVVYGQSEFGPTISLTTGREPTEAGDANVGAVLEGTEVRIIDPGSGLVSPEGQPGEIQVRGDTCMDGYFDDPEATRAALTDDRWLRTGDLGVLSHGCLRILDRIKNLIIRGGENVSASEVEEVILEWPGLQEACVVPVPSAHWGEAVCAVVQPMAGSTLDLDALLAHAGKRLARYKRPDHILCWTALPLLASGKVDRRSVKAQAEVQLTTTLPPGTES